MIIFLSTLHQTSYSFIGLVCQLNLSILNDIQSICLICNFYVVYHLYITQAVKLIIILIGASLSEPHINGTSVHELYIYNIL